MTSSQQVYVWDPLVRIGHWVLVAAFTLAFSTEEELLTLHVWAGYVVLGYVLWRMVWGIVGPQYARFTEFVRRPAVVKAYLRDLLALRASRYVGHNPAGGYMIVLLLLVLLATTLTGIVTYGVEEHRGPLGVWTQGVHPWWGMLWKGAHELLANAALLLIIVHVSGVLVECLLHRENLVRAMITGRKRKV